MTVKSYIIDGRGTGQFAGVSPSGELLITSFGSRINQSVFQSLTSANAAFNFFGPIAGQRFVITTIVMTTTTTATIQLYESSLPTSATIDKLLFKILLTSTVQTPSSLVLPLSFGHSIPVNEGVYLNAQTDVATVNVTVIGYYHPIQFNLP